MLDIPDVRRELPDFDDYDLVLVADFGHGLLDAQAINRKIAAKKRCFVAAMAQVNSSNYGYNLPVKYVGADYYSLNRTEAELSLHEKDLPFDELLDRMAALLRCRALSVTDGKQGVAVRMGDDLFSLPDAEHERRRHDRLRRRVFRAEQRGRLPRPARPAGRAGRQHRRRGDDAAPVQRAPGDRAGVHDDRQDRHLTRWNAGRTTSRRCVPA